jgi:hypothetical protein
VDHQPVPPPVQTGAGQPPFQAEWNGKTNGLACISFLMSLVGCGLLFAIVFGVVGLPYISIPAPPDALGRPDDRSAICLAFRDDATTGSVRR